MTGRLLRFCMVPGAAVWLIAATPIPTGPVALTSQPGSELEATARRVATADVADGGAGALLLLGSQPLGSGGTGPALFVQVQSQRACGSAGCSTSVYLPTRRGWHKVMDAVSGLIVVATTEHHGMHDLLVNKTDRWIWNGEAYTDTLPAPQVDLRPRHSRAATKTQSPAPP